ncbi:MAG: hypothetical protein KDA68_15290 [Planctomycetaceae bacterium]|nr:hypothetical protein [Planctomycetaceae bacterium]
MSRVAFLCRIAVCVCFVLASDALRADEGSVLLRFKFAPNQTLNYVTSTESTIVTKFDEEDPIKTENSTVAVKQYKVLNVLPTGSAEFEVMLKSVKMRAKVGDNDPEEFDSNSKDEVARVDFRKIKESIGKPQAVLRFGTIGKLEEVVKIEDTDFKPHPDEFQTMLMTLPDEPAKVGTDWSERFTVRVSDQDDPKLTHEIALSRKYNVEKIEGDLVTISMRTAVLTPVRSEFIAVQLSQREMRGEIVFDNARGLIVSRDLKVVKEVINGLGAKTLFQASTTHTEKLEELGTEAKSASN